MAPEWYIKDEDVSGRLVRFRKGLGILVVSFDVESVRGEALWGWVWGEGGSPPLGNAGRVGEGMQLPLIVRSIISSLGIGWFGSVWFWFGLFCTSFKWASGPEWEPINQPRSNNNGQCVSGRNAIT